MSSVRISFIHKLITFLTLAIVLSSLQSAPDAMAQAREKVLISVFVRDTCKHCHDEKAFLRLLQKKDPTLEIIYYDLSHRQNQDLFNQINEYYGIAQGTPLTLIRGQLIPGFGTANTTGAIIRQTLASSGPSRLRFEDITQGQATVISPAAANTVCDEASNCSLNNSFLVTIPLLGSTLDVGNFSLGSLSLVLGLVDGFNPCAMWVLVMFLLLLAQVGSKKKMWQYAGLFIVAEAITYYLILMVWFTVWDFVKLDNIVTPLVGFLALGSGLYFLYKFRTFKPVCGVTSLDEQQKIKTKAAQLVHKPMTIAVAIGVIGLALSVNIFEFACSVGIPQAFTKILEINQLNWLTTQLFIGLYIIMYMLDDIIVFGLALWSFDKISLTHKYSRWTTLIGGILMILLGLLMLFKPQWLVV